MENKDKQMSIRLTPSTYSKLVDMAQRSGLSVGPMFRAFAELAKNYDNLEEIMFALRNGRD